ncbi:MAG: hypothetical protein DRI83_03780 [Bacteroidetes bacterium]|nr:MAG: hypothetical protein DRI83_03780 [Bacteroidota bacterium]
MLGWACSFKFLILNFKFVGYFLQPTAYCLLPTAYCLPPTAYRLLFLSATLTAIKISIIETKDEILAR